MPLKCKKCGAIFPIAGRITIEKKPLEYHDDPSVTRTMVEKPCCPKCESLDIEEYYPKPAPE